MSRTLLSRLAVLALAALLLGALVQAPAQARKTVFRSVSITASAGSAVVKSAVTFSGRVTRSPKGSLISLQRRSGATWVTVKQVRTTTAAGAYRAAVTMPSSIGIYSFRALAVKKGRLRGALSRIVTVKVLNRVTVSLSASPMVVPAGSSVNLTGTVKPFTPNMLLSVQKLLNGRWTNIVSTAVQSNGTFARSITVSPTTQIRISAPANGFNASAYSPTVTVRTTPVIATSNLPNAQQFKAYSGVRLTTIDGAPGTWSVQNKPPWLVLNPTTGVLSGTPNDYDTWENVTFSFTSSIGESAPPKSFPITVTRSMTPPAIATTALPSGTHTETYSAQLTSTGPGPDRSGTWTRDPLTPLPAGLALNPSTGEITGTPTKAAVGTTQVKFTYTQENTDLSSEPKTLSITVVEAPSPTISTSALTTGTTGTEYSVNLAATGPNGSGGTAPATGTWTASPLPPGLSLNPSSGTISGTPTTAGSTNVVIGFTQGSTDLEAQEKTIALAVKPAVTTSSIMAATTGDPYSVTLAAAGGSGGTWTATPLPSGITLNASTGQLSGTPTAAGSTNVVVTYTVNGQTSASRTLELDVKPVVTTSSLATGTTGTAYSVTLAAAGGSGGTWTATPLPNGITLNASTGQLSGTPTAAGSTNVVVTYTVNGQTSASRTIALAVKPVIVTTTLPHATRTEPYAVTLDGSQSGTWTASPLPAGLSLNAGTGLISGTPTAVGSTNVVIGYTVNGQTAASKTLTLVVDEADPPVITTTSLPDGTVGSPYGFQVQAQGNPAGEWDTEDPLPAGLSIDAGDGTISGTPTVAGDFTVTVLFTQDSTGLSTSRTFSLHLDPAPEVP